MYKLGKNHVVANALSRLLNITKPTSVLDLTTDASFLHKAWMAEGCERIYENMTD